jgi:uncharacterized protein YbjT (DUF2867 family)
MYVIAGATGKSGHVVAGHLLAKGKKVRALGRSEERLQPLAARGAEPFVCDLADAADLAKAFAGAEGVYAMIPPDMSSQDYRAHQDRISDAIAAAVTETKVRHVVVLSSFGADKSDKTGPVAGLHSLEEKLGRIAGLNAFFVRAGYFMENTLAQIGIIKAMGVAAGPLRAELELPMIATRDIGAFAAERLAGLDFSGVQAQELLGQRDISMAEAAGIIGRAIGRPQLSYVRLPNDQVVEAFVQMGASKSTAQLMIEMTDALNVGHMAALENRTAENSTPTSYEAFVKEEFAPRFLGKPASA